MLRYCFLLLLCEKLQHVYCLNWWKHDVVFVGKFLTELRCHSWQEEHATGEAETHQHQYHHHHHLPHHHIITSSSTISSSLSSSSSSSWSSSCQFWNCLRPASPTSLPSSWPCRRCRRRGRRWAQSPQLQVPDLSRLQSEKWSFGGFLDFLRNIRGILKLNKGQKHFESFLWTQRGLSAASYEFERAPPFFY